MADPVRRCLKLLVLTLVLAESVAFLGCHAKGNGEARLQRGSVSEDDSSLFRSGEVSGAERRELSTTSCKLVWVVKSGKRQCTCSTTKNCKLVCVVKNGVSQCTCSPPPPPCCKPGTKCQPGSKPCPVPCCKPGTKCQPGSKPCPVPCCKPGTKCQPGSKPCPVPCCKPGTKCLLGSKPCPVPCCKPGTKCQPGSKPCPVPCCKAGTKCQLGSKPCPVPCCKAGTKCQLGSKPCPVPCCKAGTKCQLGSKPCPVPCCKAGTKCQPGSQPCAPVPCCKPGTKCQPGSKPCTPAPVPCCKAGTKCQPGSEPCPPPPTAAEATYDPKAHWGIVKPKGLLFNAGDGSTFIMNGWNTRDVVYNARTAPGRARVTKLFTHARSMGLTVVRAMICNEGSSRMVQKSPDVFDETVLVAMDWVMREAKTFGIRLVLTFAGNWESKAVYASWYKQRSGNNMTVPDDFFRVKEMKDWYKALVRKVITRKNTITGMLYTDEPAVFSWQLMNEPRATSDLTGKTVQNWLREMAVFVKSLDKKHMVCTGVEGFYGPSDPSRYPFNPDTWAQEQGNDFVAEGKIANIDYLTVHIYPQLWIPKRPYSTMLSFTSKWILGHVEDGRKLNMPLVFEEFGWKGDDVNATQGRNGFFQVVFKETLAAAQGKQMAGTMFWALEDPAAFFSSWAVWYERDINSTISMISNYSLEINKLMKSFRFTAT